MGSAGHIDYAGIPGKLGQQQSGQKKGAKVVDFQLLIYPILRRQANDSCTDPAMLYSSA